MKFDLWFSAVSFNCRFICARKVINKPIEFSFDQMGSVKNKMHQIRFGQGRALNCTGGTHDAPQDPLVRWEEVPSRSTDTEGDPLPSMPTASHIFCSFCLNLS